MKIIALPIVLINLETITIYWFIVCWYNIMKLDCNALCIIIVGAASMVSHRGHNCIFSALTILDSALTS